MGKVSEKIQVKVEDKGIEGDSRVFTIHIEGKEALFSLSNILAKEGAIETLPKRLRALCRVEVVKYIKAGKKALIELKKKEGIEQESPKVEEAANA